MNTKLIMTLSAMTLGLLGIALTFAPAEILGALKIDTQHAGILLGQTMGALYFGFAMLNWMNKERPIGGIYNRPVVVANLSHFAVAGLALIKALTSDNTLAIGVWVAGAVYLAFGILYTIILFRHPVAETQQA